MERPGTQLQGGQEGFPEEAPKLRGSRTGEGAGWGEGWPPFQAEGHLPRPGLGAFQELLSPRPGVAIPLGVSRLEHVQESASASPGRLSWVRRGPHAVLACCPGAKARRTCGCGAGEGHTRPGSGH